ncbi:MAG: TIGR00268 family protein, partial [Clostridiales Family XIII bacterium]|nr:TIGR00268 family protein [Clostridiales Family XIII bacterium]
SPLREAGYSKDDIRAQSEKLGLPTWNKQSFACLSSRFVYGETITEKKLGMVDKAEQLLLDLGFTQVRVRVHGTEGEQARIEIRPEEFERLISPQTREKVCETFGQLGFKYISMDLRGYRTGSMNETLPL